MRRLLLVLLLVSSPALADPHGLAHPLARECAVTDTDCVAVHDERVVALATFMGVASYCKASTASARCREAVAVTVAVVKAEHQSAANAEPTPAAPVSAKTAKNAPETATYIDLSGPPESAPEPEFPDVAKKGTL